jgi:hypothetical protein
MKSLSLSAMLFFGSVLFSNAQKKDDLGTTVDNYKHPNKASKARKLNLDKKATLIVTDTKPSTNALKSKSNYKGEFLKSPDGNASVSKEEAVSKELPNLSKDNYKAQTKNISGSEKK